MSSALARLKSSIESPFTHMRTHTHKHTQRRDSSAVFFEVGTGKLIKKVYTWSTLSLIFSSSLVCFANFLPERFPSRDQCLAEKLACGAEVNMALGGCTDQNLMHPLQQRYSIQESVPSIRFLRHQALKLWANCKAGWAWTKSGRGSWVHLSGQVARLLFRGRKLAADGAASMLQDSEHVPVSWGSMRTASCCHSSTCSQEISLLISCNQCVWGQRLGMIVQGLLL